MKYSEVCEAKFIERPNRFIARVLLEGKELTVHVKNTGRCRELLLPGTRVFLEKSDNPERKTLYDLVAVEKAGRIINIDSQAPEIVVGEWLSKFGKFDVIKPQYKYGNSRIDYYMIKDGREYLLEVKGCTLFRDGVGYFPDAPTERGAKHLGELTKALKEGYKSCIAFVIQGESIEEVRPNAETDPAFTAAYLKALKAGVKVLFLRCKVTETTLEIIGGEEP